MKRPKLLLLLAAGMLFAFLLVACNEPESATTTASCAFVVGDGKGGHDADLHEIIYPGQDIQKSDSERVTFVPCNSRNYIINDGSVFNANGERVGDRHQLITAYTSTGVPINVGVTAFWTLNQSESAMRSFYNVCFKYQCASGEDVSGDANFSTPGWNGMLSENFGPTLEAIAKKAAEDVDDNIWKLQDPDDHKELADKMSALFADNMRQRLGFRDDLFCGSGNSSWTDPSKPGEGTFTCFPVRIEVTEVVRGDVNQDESTEGIQTINRTRLENAQALYGPIAGEVLATLDIIEACRAAETTCIINLGDVSNSPAISIPQDDPTPVPSTPTPEEDEEEEE